LAVVNLLALAGQIQCSDEIKQTAQDALEVEANLRSKIESLNHQIADLTPKALAYDKHKAMEEDVYQQELMDAIHSGVADSDMEDAKRRHAARLAINENLYNAEEAYANAMDSYDALAADSNTTKEDLEYAKKHMEDSYGKLTVQQMKDYRSRGISPFASEEKDTTYRLMREAEDQNASRMGKYWNKARAAAYVPNYGVKFARKKTGQFADYMVKPEGFRKSARNKWHYMVDSEGLRHDARSKWDYMVKPEGFRKSVSDRYNQSKETGWLSWLKKDKKDKQEAAAPATK